MSKEAFGRLIFAAIGVFGFMSIWALLFTPSSFTEAMPLYFHSVTLIFVVIGGVGWGLFGNEVLLCRELSSELQKYKGFTWLSRLAGGEGFQEAIHHLLESKAAECNNASQRVIAFQRQGLSSLSGLKESDLKDEGEVEEFFQRRLQELTFDFKTSQKGFYYVYDMVAAVAEDLSMDLRERSFKAWLPASKQEP